MRKLSLKAVLIPTLTLFLVCIIIAAALALTNAVTAKKIAENEAASQQESMKTVCPNAKSFELVKESDLGTIYAGYDENKNIVGYAVDTVASGYGGQIKVMTGIKDEEIIAIDVYYNDDETPGLGKNTSNESFTENFKGLLSDDSIFVDKDYNGEGQKVDSVTSATISSRAVVNAVNNACKLYNNEISGGEQ